MSRPKITITNTNAKGKVTDSWSISINGKWRSFNAESWAASGISYIQEQLRKFGS